MLYSEDAMDCTHVCCHKLIYVLSTTSPHTNLSSSMPLARVNLTTFPRKNLAFYNGWKPNTLSIKKNINNQ